MSKFGALGDAAERGGAYEGCTEELLRFCGRGGRVGGGGVFTSLVGAMA